MLVLGCSEDPPSSQTGTLVISPGPSLSLRREITDTHSSIGVFEPLCSKERMNLMEGTVSITKKVRSLLHFTDIRVYYGSKKVATFI